MDLTSKQIASLNTRLVASESLLKALTYLLKNEERISEVSLCNKWLEEMRKNNNIFSDGWYNPPPHGLSVLFGTDDNFDRISPSTLRPPESWPRSDVFLNRKNGIISVYVSPVNKKTGMIGDFGLTLYFGINQQIKNHLKTCLSIDRKIFKYSQVGMQLSEIYNYTQKLFLVEGLKNNIASPTDPTKTNIGHTIPASYENWNNDEMELFKSNSDWKTICDTISKRRKFINSTEQLTIKPNMSITIEPRPQVINNPNIPMVWFHTMVFFKPNGSKEHITGFEELFKLIGMDYMLDK
jgi:hypothetical protein